MRRFDLWPKYACRFYHDAAARENRNCHDMIPGSSRRHSGCPKKTSSKGYTSCVC
ncbi:hypothetical protein Hanom_Chr05g00466161 [Helianthus anomalus]